MIKIAQIPLAVNLADLSYWLNMQGYKHRIAESLGEQVLLLEDESKAEQVQRALQLYLTDQSFRLQIDETPKKHFLPPQFDVGYPRARPSQAPFVYVFMLLSAVFALLTDFGQGGSILRSFLILDPFSLETGDFKLNLNTLYGRMQGLWFTLNQGELWRLVSPVFIHFNVMHITFNLLMLWLLGGQLEVQKGSFAFLSLAVFVAAISNVAQLFETSYLFGGMSGVVYGLVGYCWLWKHFEPKIFFPDILMKFSLVWLILGYTPVTEWLGWGRMANAAHLYGLISGLIWGGLMAALKTMKQKKDPG